MFTDYRVKTIERKNYETFCHNNGIKYEEKDYGYTPARRKTADEIQAEWNRQRNGLCY